MTKRMKTAVVCGAGPVGMLAAAELCSREYQVTIYTDKMPDLPKGPFYFHDLPAGIKCGLPASAIRHQAIGTAEGYETKKWGKVYGSSWPQPDEVHVGWWPSHQLWNRLRLCAAIERAVVAPDTVNSLAMYNDIVVVTFPLPKTRSNTKTFCLAEIGLESARQVLDFEPAAGALIYDGLTTGYHAGIIRISTPLFAYEQGLVYLELKEESSLVERWPRAVSTFHAVVPDHLPLKYPWAEPNVLFAGRAATGDPEYLAHQVLAGISTMLGDA